MGRYRILVTGGAGFIGSNFVRFSRYLGNDITVYDAFTYAGRYENLPRDVEVIKGDITDYDRLKDVVQRIHPEIIVNFAAETHVDRSIVNPEPFIRTNVYGVYTILKIVKEFGTRLIHISTDEVYGDMEGKEPADENTVLRPSNPYAATKAAGDALIMAFHRTYGVDAIIIRPSNNYGPYQYPEKLIPRTVIRALNDIPVVVHGDGSQRRDWLYVEDTCRAVLTIIEKGVSGEIYNVPGFNEKSILQVVEDALRVLNKPKALIRFVSDRPGQDRRYIMKGDKILSLGWRPLVIWEDGLKKTIKWYLENEWWWRPLLSDEFFRKDTPW
ncbi:MAG: dTDP-glucose 4,6-dehydratase [Vulcanisaeta sp.]|uniref:dTDP-glucose 4,6-dehydratase n=1 Tax=Vulcanisaeta moutnovskia (strain 768-28) TaxID=985053 RepID=F0QSE3_VULM7|nr:dTDP-glucose 4,6-dehydratase [Vulcanisaeta moutnovskia]ADY00294.1 dTDP-glucose 4,6-dehydratase [Vulcanisaeta moutnovskia 768-28]